MTHSDLFDTANELRVGQIMELIVTFRMLHADLDPATVTAILGVAPTRAHQRGDRVTISGPPGFVIRREGLWALSIEFGDKVQLSDRVMELLQHIPADIRSSPRFNEYYMDVRIGMLNVGPLDNTVELRAACIAAMAARGLELMLDVYPSELSSDTPEMVQRLK